MTDAAPPLVRHLEAHLGPMGDGPAVRRPQVRIVRFENQPAPDATTFVTLGLSDLVVRAEDGGAGAQELMLSSWNGPDLEALGVLLHVAAEDLLRTPRPVVPGTILGPGGPLLLGSTMETLAAMPQAYYPEGLEILATPGKKIRLVELVPLAAGEAAFLHEKGADALRALLEAQEPDLLDFRRDPIKL